MPRQTGPIVFTGAVGELCFYKDKVHGYLIRTKGGPTKKQIKKRKSMAVVRQNNNEFGKASAHGALLRRSFRMLLLHCREYSMSRRLQSIISAVIKMDVSRDAGKRDIVKDHLVALQGFELNKYLSYRKFFKKDVDIETKKNSICASGYCTIAKTITREASHYKVISVAASVNFQKKVFVNDIKESGLLSCKESKAFKFEHRLRETDYLFYGLAICFYTKKGDELQLITDDKMKAGFLSFA